MMEEMFTRKKKPDMVRSAKTRPKSLLYICHSIGQNREESLGKNFKKSRREGKKK